MASDIVHVLVYLVLITVATCVSDPVVLTKVGKVKGILAENEKGIYYRFLRIPYAKPPTGELRFKKPEPAEPRNDVIDATVYPPACPQPTHWFQEFLETNAISEDCLFLNIYVPNELSSANKKSVMVWIHGGGYHMGRSSYLSDGSYLALTGDVIIVTINYRLNVFGFLSTWDSVAPGNYGIWDQIMALQWVHDNIESFGGNPDSVTIFGESAGGFSVSLLSLIPRNIGLFQRVIAQSGTANSPWAYNEKYKSHLKLVLEEVGCNDNLDDHSRSIIECLKQVPAENFSNITDQIFWAGMFNESILPFSPRVDNDLFILEPKDILNDPSSLSTQFMRSLDYMVGFTDAEGALIFMASQVMAIHEPFNVTDGIPTKFLRDTLFPVWVRSHYDNSSDVKDAICKKYAVENGDTTRKMEQGRNAINANGDYLFFSPAIDSLNTHVRKNTLSQTYHYIFSRHHHGGYGVTYPKWFEGAPHAHEMPYLFNLKYFSEKAKIAIQNDDFRLSEIMMKYWTNFAKTGNPNSGSLPHWPQYTEENMEFINLNSETKQEKASNEFKSRINFWLNEIPNIHKLKKTSDHEEL